MAYENFIPTIWNETINRGLERSCVYVEDCNRQYEGNVKDKGDSVRILGIGKPNIKTLDRNSADGDIDDPETIADEVQVLKIQQISYFNYLIGDIDKAQAVNGVMDAISKETSEQLANVVDKYVSSFAVDSAVKSLYDTPALIRSFETSVAGEMYVLDVLDEAIQKLYENDVASTTDIVVTISPRFYTLFKKAYIKADTNNSEIMENGRVTKYGNVTVKLSNNVHRTDGGATDNIMIRTKRAVAFVNSIAKVEPYRPEKKFADAVKGFILYDAKVVRPDEIININVKYK